MHAILGYLIADLGARLLPSRWADGIGVCLARVLFALQPPARRAAERNLARLAPRLDDAERRALARSAFEHFALCLLDFLRFARRGAARSAVEIRGRPHLEAALATRRGVILLSAHVGHWERGAAFVTGLGARLHVLARPHPNRWVDGLFQRRRREVGVQTLPGRPVWRAAAALRRGEWVAVLGDRGSAAAPSVCSWASALARRTGAVVLPAAMVRLAPGRYAACFDAPLSPAECATGGYREAMRRYLGLYPAQWCAFEAMPAEWS